MLSDLEPLYPIAYTRDNLKNADVLLARHLGPKHPIRLQLKELIESLK